MKNLLILAFSCFLLGNTYAQDFKTEHSSYFKKESEKDIYQIVFPSAYGFMTLHHLDNVFMDNTKAMVLTKYDQSMQALETKTFNLPKLGLRASDLEHVIELEDKLIFISSVMHKKMGKHQVNAQVYSQQDNNVSANKVLASFPIDSYSKSGFYQIAVSPDQTKIAIFANMPFERKSQEQVKVWVYDNQLNLLWEQNETLNYDSERAYQENVYVNNMGVVFLNKTTDAFKKSRKSELISFNGTTASTQNFSSAGFIPMETKLINVNGKSMLIGFFWNGKKSVIRVNSKEGDDNDGAFLYDLEAAQLIGIHEWSDEIDSRDLKSLKVVDVKIVGDDIFMIGEKQLKTSEFKKDGTTPSTEMDHFYTFGSSVIVNFDFNGTLKGFTPLYESKSYKNHSKEVGSLSALYIDGGLNVFSNNKNRITVDTYFKENVHFEKPSVIPYENGTSTVPNILPSTVRTVNNYGLMYYITNYRDRYWLNKTTW